MTIKATLTLNGLSASGVEIRISAASVARAPDGGFRLTYAAEYAVSRPWRETVRFPERILANEWVQLPEPKPDVLKWTEAQLAKRTETAWVSLGQSDVAVEADVPPLAAAYEALKAWPVLANIKDA